MKNFKQWNEKMVKKYHPEGFYEKGSWLFKQIEKRRFNNIMNMIGSKNSLVLDAGCGDGMLTSYIDKRNYVGVDLSKEQIRKARKYHTDFKFILASLEKLPFKNNTFSVVVCSEVIEHVLNPKKVVKELYRVTEPEGIVIFTVPNEPFRVKMKHFFGLNRPLDIKWHRHYFDTYTLTELVCEYFEWEEEVSSPSFLFPLNYVVKFRKTNNPKRVGDELYLSNLTLSSARSPTLGTLR